ncbi:uncharacterized protein [Fopius arisanus]|uniref:Uncharacterized protein isoform X2 n=1 Tax=Fopius arisanus TaxID=64838 RepID=A0A9R1TP52_9HYME|nr:PREDICTED: uncharacterized protein LOC105272215 isoform X2 [Fopius arisanus]
MRTIIILVVVEIFGFVIFASDPCQNCEEISKKVENFSNDIQNEMAKTHRGNFATAPFNLFSILTMVTYAVFGRSNTQLKKALRYDDYKCLRRALISIVEKLHNESSGSMVDIFILHS